MYCLECGCSMVMSDRRFGEPMEIGRAQQSKKADNPMKVLRDHPCVASDLMEKNEVKDSRVSSSSSICVPFTQRRKVALTVTYGGASNGSF